MMPGPSPWPGLAALFTAGFFLLLTVQAYTPAIVSGVLAIPSMMRWLWDTDRPVSDRDVDVGGGIMLPTYATGSSTHGWWATVILLVVILMMFIMTLFSFAFLFGIHPSYWTDMGNRWSFAPVVAGYALAAALAVLGRHLLSRERSTHWSPTVQMIFASLAIAIAYGLDLWSWRSLDVELSAQSAVIAVFLAQQGLLSAIVLLMAMYLSLRTARALGTKPRNVTVDVIFLFVLYTASQGAVSATVTRLFPFGL
jgi:cytochrome c oxidase subunit I+III